MTIFSRNFVNLSGRSGVKNVSAESGNTKSSGRIPGLINTNHDGGSFDDGKCIAAFGESEIFHSGV